jgi:iron complex transport system permease protein
MPPVTFCVRFIRMPRRLRRRNSAVQYAVAGEVRNSPSVVAGRRVAGRTVVLASSTLLAIAVALSLAIGATEITLLDLPEALASIAAGREDASREALVLLDIRLPRTLLAMFVGAALAVSGAMMQGLFRNPLADPSVLGVSSGAALAAVFVIAFGPTLGSSVLSALGIYATPVAAFAGAMTVTAVLVGLAGRRGQIMVGTLLLAGVAIAALAQALIGLIAFASDDRALRDLTLWMLGSLAGASWPKVLAVAPFTLALLLLVPFAVRGLNGLLFGEAEAFHLGINVERTKGFVMIATSLAIGASVAVAGVIGFVGIVVPHIVRLLAGPDHRTVLPASALLGAALALAADIVARTAVAPAELPIGIVMALVGAPAFLHLVLKRRVGGMG